jgi:nucleotide-binding universal stress UspA family protein
MCALRRERVVVGVDGSLASLRALREAVAEARRRDATLIVVHVRPPARLSPDLGIVAVVPYPTPAPAQRADESLDQEAELLIAQCIYEGLGEPPADIEMVTDVAVGRPHTELVSQVSRDNDLLVVGTRNRRCWAHPWRRSVSKYCASHARCPVLVVPPDRFVRDTRRERRWHRSLLGRNPWKRFDTVLQETPLHVGDA